ncbi:MBOAT family O-acyltransferase [Saccharicrinis aurantiacus]|uniref:MBOAT family O-acyltransferase n=1 Tax=Saccharicrinis aurantiacus TaxID=1849719 RepID=UPI0024916087|nr:MBOAT family O-acyltransferase [Saccharicrinis aurantiacus]
MIDQILSILTYNPESSFVYTHMAFWIFFGFVLLGNAILYKKSVLRNAFLFACSLFFYYKAGGIYFGLLVFSTIIDYSIGIGISRSSNLLKRKILLSLSIFVNLGLLAYFKYSYFISDLVAEYFNLRININNYYTSSLNAILGTHFTVSDIILPVGISFFTFQTISYSVDVYRGKVQAVRSIIDFGFYVSFFPQLVAGPIVRAWEFIPQLHKRYQLSYKWFWWSVWLIMMGLFKKMVISDYLSVNLVDRVFDSPMMYSGMELLLGAYAYTLQIYCDFSGYTDIAIGVALLLGFRLPQNFNAPYKSTSVTEFWHRWHISLSSWLRDYLYIPLGGNRKGKFRQGLNLMITMLLGGLWHGAGWMFVIWGALHGFALLIDKVLLRISHNLGFRFPKILGRVFTFHFITLTWIVFRSSDIESFNLFIYRIQSAFSIYPINYILAKHSFAVFLIFIGFMSHWLPDNLNRLIKVSFIKSSVILKLLFIIVISIIVYQFSLLEVKPFIYFRF